MSRSTTSSSRSMKNDIVMMPIGVPKVAYRVPGSQSADWYVSSCDSNVILVLSHSGIHVFF